jgi:endonuclease/exonuclease/phosphatase (EEP) superfamily protein YafD
VLLTLGCLLSLTGYLGRYYFLFEQIDSFRPQYLIVAAAGVVLAIMVRHWISVALLCLVCVLHASELLRFYFPSSVPPTASLRVMSVNLLASNRDSRALLMEIERINPDVMIFQEYTPYWHQVLSANLGDYAHRIDKVIDSPFGIAAYSRLAFYRQEVNYYNQRVSPAVDVQVRIEGQAVRIIGIHPVPPMTPSTYDRRNRYFDELVRQVGGAQIPVIVMGDFNATPWSFKFEQLLERGGLKSTRDGFGIHPTWPTGFWPLWTPIDHIVHNEALQRVYFDTGRSIGSDHKPVWADLSLKR